MLAATSSRRDGTAYQAEPAREPADGHARLDQAARAIALVVEPERERPWRRRMELSDDLTEVRPAEPVVPVGLVILEDRLLAHAGDDLERGGTHLGRDQLGPEPGLVAAPAAAPGSAGVPKTSLGAAYVVSPSGPGARASPTPCASSSCGVGVVEPFAFVDRSPQATPFVESIHERRARSSLLRSASVPVSLNGTGRPVVGRDDQEAVGAARRAPRGRGSPAFAGAPAQRHRVPLSGRRGPGSKFSTGWRTTMNTA